MTAKFFAFDLETTGLNAHDGDEIISCAFMVLDAGLNCLEEGAVFVTPTCPVHPDAASVNGYTPELWAQRGAISRDDLLFGLRALWDDHKCYRVTPLGQNTGFDLNFLQAQGKHDADFAKSFLKSLAFHWQDTISLALAIDTAWGIDAPTYRLYDLAKRYGVSLEGAHDAQNDIRATVALYRALLEQVASGKEPPPAPPASFIELRNGVWYMRAGKHRGKSLDQVQKGYLMWALKEVSLPSDERLVIQALFRR